MIQYVVMRSWRQNPVETPAHRTKLKYILRNHKDIFVTLQATAQ